MSPQSSIHSSETLPGIENAATLPKLHGVDGSIVTKDTHSCFLSWTSALALIELHGMAAHVQLKGCSDGNIFLAPQVRWCYLACGSLHHGQILEQADFPDSYDAEGLTCETRGQLNVNRTRYEVQYC